MKIKKILFRDGERLFTVSMSREELNFYSMFSPVAIQ